MKLPKTVYLFLLIPFVVAGCSSTGSIRNSLKSAVERGDLEEVRSQFTTSGMGRHIRDENGKTLLHLAAGYGHADIVKFLLANGMNPDTTDRIGDTALQLAAYSGYRNIAEQLLAAGANVNTVNNYGISPLLNALFNEQYEMARLLIHNGANVNAKNKNGNSPLHVAVKKGNLEFVKFMVTNGADVRASGTFNFKPIHVAAENGHLELVKFLVTKGAAVNATDTYGRTPVHEAVLNGNLEVVKFLIQNGANPNTLDLQGNTPLKLAKNSGYRDIEYFITGLGADDGKNITGAAAPSGDYSARVNSKSTKPAVPVISPEVDFGNYHALVIGNNEYTHLPKLQTAKSDARDVARILNNNYGFQVELLLDANRSRILLALNRLRSQLSPKDNLLIYYAGHGWLDREGDEGYWLPIGAEPGNSVNWVSNSSITTVLKAMKAKHVLIVADSCYAGKLARGLHTIEKSSGYLSRISVKRARSVLSSGGLEPVVDSGGTGYHSVFASAFINALLENENIMDGTQLFNNIRRPVMLNSDQTPEYSDLRKAGHDGGDFIFLRKQ